MAQAGDMQTPSWFGGPPNFTDALGNKVTLKGDEARATLDPSVRRNAPLYAATFQYQNMAPENTLSWQIGSGLHNIFTRPNIVGSALDHGPLAGAATLGGLGAAAGYGVGALAGIGKDKETAARRRNRMALLAGLAGTAAGAYSGYWRTKIASQWLEDQAPEEVAAQAQEMVLRMLRSAPDVSTSEKRQLAEGVMQLSENEAQNLLALLRRAGGFTIGAAIARFLLKAGIGGTIAGGLVGGAVGHALAPKPPKDAFGRPSMNHKDLFGNTLR